MTLFESTLSLTNVRLRCYHRHSQAAYRSMMLSGLAPDVILEIASRALSFFTFQMGFELVCFNIFGNLNPL